MVLLLNSQLAVELLLLISFSLLCPTTHNYVSKSFIAKWLKISRISHPTEEQDVTFPSNSNLFDFLRFGIEISTCDQKDN